jgi:hypothetical protein
MCRLERNGEYFEDHVAPRAAAAGQQASSLAPAKLRTMAQTKTVYALFACSRLEGNELRTRTVRELSEPEYEACRSSIRAVEGCLYSFDTYVRYAVEDLERSRDDLLKNMAIHSFQMSPAQAGSELEFRIINICAAIKMYADHVQIILGRLYGKESAERLNALKKFSDLYDSNLAFRVCNHLRNALVHSGAGGLLSTILRSEAVISDETTESAQVLLDRQGFRHRAQNAKVRDEVADLPHDLELITTTLEAAGHARRLHEDLILTLHPELMPAIRQLVGLFAEASTDHEWPALMEITPSNPEGSRIKPMPLSTEVREYVNLFMATKQGWASPQENSQR